MKTMEQRLIDEIEYQDKVAMIPMEERTFVKAWQTAQEMPTVDAIPVAFIEEKMRRYEVLAYQSTPKIQQRYFDRETALKSLIEQWHEKNGKGEDDE